MTTATTRARQPWTQWVKGRWPTALALLIAVRTFGESQTDEGVTALAQAALLLQLEYLVITKLRRREASWPVIVALFIPFAVLRELDVVDPAIVLSALSLVVLVWGAVEGQLDRPDPFRVQALGALGFGALAVAGLVLDPDLGRYVVAAAFFLHGIWDFVHLKLDKAVALSYAEFCGVVDVLIAVELVTL
jgi:Ni/Fe-hydrogenase subunit HybB-like protein